MEENIIFEEDKIYHLGPGIIYCKSQPLIELDNGTYDNFYILSLLDQYKYISKTIPCQYQMYWVEKKRY